MSGTSAMTFSAFEARLALEEVPAVVVFAGRENWFRQRGVEALLERLFPAGDSGGAIRRLSGLRAEDVPAIRDVVAELEMKTLFGPRRARIVSEPDAVRAPGEKALVSTTLTKAVLERGLADAWLIMDTERAVKGREAISTATLLKAGAWVVDCRRLYDAPAPWDRSRTPHDYELTRHLVQRMKARGRALALEVAHLIVQRVGSDLWALENALSTLHDAVPQDRPLEETACAKVLGWNREDEVWPLVEALLDGNASRASALLEQARRNGLSDGRRGNIQRADSLAIYVLATLEASLFRTLKAAEILGAGHPPDEVLREAGVPAFLAGSLLERARRGTAHWMALVGPVYQAEKGIKTGTVPPELALELVLLAMCGKARPSREAARAAAPSARGRYPA